MCKQLFHIGGKEVDKSFDKFQINCTAERPLVKPSSNVGEIPALTMALASPSKVPKILL